MSGINIEVTAITARRTRPGSGGLHVGGMSVSGARCDT